MMECPCQSHENFQNCCEPYLKGQKNPDTAEKLMRSRYTAYTQNQMDYILETHDPKTREEFDLEASKAWAQKADWLGLEIQSVAEGGPEDQEGSVEFVAKYSENGVAREHREESQFRRYKGQWYFVRGKHPEVETFVRTEEKVGRNDPCPCGSGKKHKKCCG